VASSRAQAHRMQSKDKENTRQPSLSFDASLRRNNCHCSPETAGPNFVGINLANSSHVLQNLSPSLLASDGSRR